MRAAACKAETGHQATETGGNGASRNKKQIHVCVMLGGLDRAWKGLIVGRYGKAIEERRWRGVRLSFGYSAASGC